MQPAFPGECPMFVIETLLSAAMYKMVVISAIWINIYIDKNGNGKNGHPMENW